MGGRVGGGGGRKKGGRAGVRKGCGGGGRGDLKWGGVSQRRGVCGKGERGVVSGESGVEGWEGVEVGRSEGG